MHDTEMRPAAPDRGSSPERRSSGQFLPGHGNKIRHPLRLTASRRCREISGRGRIGRRARIDRHRDAAAAPPRGTSKTQKEIIMTTSYGMTPDIGNGLDAGRRRHRSLRRGLGAVRGLVLAAGSASAAAAHPGHGSQPAHALEHYLGDPLHLAPVVALAALGLLALRLRRNAPRQRAPVVTPSLAWPQHGLYSV
jgi:hypothetical protein